MAADTMWAVVVAKDLAQAKQRLAGVLMTEERRGLALAMLMDVLGALDGVPDLAGRIVVTRDDQIAAVARSFGARVIMDLWHEGPTMAATLAAVRLAAEGARGMLAIPTDVPLTTATEVKEILATARTPPAVTLVPALADMGSNAVALTPIDAIPLRFGARSFLLHQKAALERGIEPHILRVPGVGLDIDRPADLMAFIAHPSATRSYRYLEERGVVSRLRKALAERDSTGASDRAACQS